MNEEDFQSAKSTEYLPFLVQVLSPRRFEHSLGAMKVMGELASIYDLDEVKAMTAGLLHDAAKDLGYEQQVALAKQRGIEISFPCEWHPAYLHAPVGASFVSRELNVGDKEVLDAIAAHSYSGGRDNFDTTFTRCLRSADVIVPMKEWHGMKKLREAVCEGRIEEAALLQSAWLIEYFQKIHVPVHPWIEEEVQRLTSKLKVGADFFARW